MTRLPTPLLIINCKNFPEALGARVLRLGQAAQAVTRELSVGVAIAPPSPFLAEVAARVQLPVLAQHVDPDPAGSTTGALVVEAIKEAGASGSLLNHSEHRIPTVQLGRTLARLHAVGLEAVVCARTPSEVRRLARFEPSFLAIEPPELIGSGIAVSRARPEIVSASVNAVRSLTSVTRVLCGAGIVGREDVEAARRLGVDGLLVASSIVRAPDWAAKIRELATPLR